MSTNLTFGSSDYEWQHVSLGIFTSKCDDLSFWIPDLESQARILGVKFVGGTGGGDEGGSGGAERTPPPGSTSPPAGVFWTLERER